MRIRFSVFIATSLDGYIARKNGDLAGCRAAMEQVLVKITDIVISLRV